jgi:hypothetical protein
MLQIFCHHNRTALALLAGQSISREHDDWNCLPSRIGFDAARRNAAVVQVRSRRIPLICLARSRPELTVRWDCRLERTGRVQGPFSASNIVCGYLGMCDLIPDAI